MTFPRMARVEARRRGPALRRAAVAADRALRDLSLSERIGPGQRVAITGGSRGIAELAAIIRRPRSLRARSAAPAARRRAGPRRRASTLAIPGKVMSLPLLNVLC